MEGAKPLLVTIGIGLLLNSIVRVSISLFDGRIAIPALTEPWQRVAGAVFGVILVIAGLRRRDEPDATRYELSAMLVQGLLWMVVLHVFFPVSSGRAEPQRPAASRLTGTWSGELATVSGPYRRATLALRAGDAGALAGTLSLTHDTGTCRFTVRAGAAAPDRAELDMVPEPGAGSGCRSGGAHVLSVRLVDLLEVTDRLRPTGGGAEIVVAHGRLSRVPANDPSDPALNSSALSGEA